MSDTKMTPQEEDRAMELESLNGASEDEPSQLQVAFQHTPKPEGYTLVDVTELAARLSEQDKLDEEAADSIVAMTIKLIAVWNGASEIVRARAVEKLRGEEKLALFMMSDHRAEEEPTLGLDPPEDTEEHELEIAEEAMDSVTEP